MHNKDYGFTIIELLVVIVLIGILAAISVTAYSGFAVKAGEASLVSDLSGASKQLSLIYATTGSYPANLPVEISSSVDNSFYYSQLADGSGYCLSAVSVRSGVRSHHVSNTSSVAEDVCDDRSTVSVTGVSVATGSTVEVPEASAALIVITTTQSGLPTSVSVGGRAATHLYTATPGTGGVPQAVSYFWLNSPPSGNQSITRDKEGGIVGVIGIENANPTSPLRGAAQAGTMSPTSETSSSLSPTYREGDLIVMAAARRASDLSLMSSNISYQSVLVAPVNYGSLHSSMIVSSPRTPVGINGFARYSSHAAISIRHFGR